MANEIVNEIINEEGMEVIEMAPEKAGVNFGKIGFGVLAAGAVIALGCKVYKLVKDRKAAKAQQEAVEKNLCKVNDEEDFEDYEESEK